MPSDPHCAECHKVTGGCAAHNTSYTFTDLAPAGPGCGWCNWTGMVGVQAPHKPLGVTMLSVPCPQCAPTETEGTD